MKRIRKWTRSALLSACDACDGIVTGITGDYRPQGRKDYGAALVFGLLILLVTAAVAVITVCCLVMLACAAFATHPLASCIVAGSILAVVTVMYVAGRLRMYVYKRFEKGE